MAGARGKSKRRARDVYEHDSDDAAEAREAARMEIDGVYEYEAPEKIKADEDSEIDEDGAFDSDDEATFGNFFQGKAKKEASDDDEEEEVTGDLLSDMLGTTPAARLSTAGDDEEDDDEEDDDDDSKHAALMNMVDQMAKGSKRKVVHAETTEDVAPSAFSKKLGGGQLTLESLMASSMPSMPGDDEDAEEIQPTAQVAKVKQQLAQLERDDSKLAAPLAPTLEARASRKVAYEEKKKDLAVFQPVVKANREKETLDFRSQGEAAVNNISVAALTSKFKPEKPLEQDVAALLATSGWSDKAAAKQEAEELEMNAVSAEEIKARQKELAKMRVMMFYEEQKHRRVKKIKSKLYHKIRNKQDAKRERAQLRELDPELADQLDREEAEKRAEERMTLKHNNTSKWVKHQLARGIQADKGTRQAIHDQIRRGDELRRKMDTVANESDLSSDEESDEDPNETETQRLQRRLAKKASTLVMEIENDGAKTSKADGLHGMKFMQKAVEKQRERALNDAERLLQELRGEDPDYNSDDQDANPKPAKKAKKTVVSADDKAAVASRMVDGSQQMTSVMMDKSHKTRVTSAIKVDFGDDATTTDLTVEKIEDPVVAKDAAVEKEEQTFEATPAVEEENPWLNSTSSKKRKKKQNKKKGGDKASIGAAIEALATTTAAPAALGPSEKDLKKRKADEPADSSNKKKKVEASTTNTKQDTKDKSKKASAAELAQDELVRRAFAFADDGDEIQKEKDELAAQDGDAKSGAEVAKLTGMSGWGSWAGEGVKPSFRQQQRLELAKKVAADAKAAALAKRKDAKMNRVLINEKKDKKAAKFMCATVPYPFTSREQYEMAMRNPLGSDWNTTKSTNALTAPAVMLRAGKIIQPLQLTKEQKNKATELTKQPKKSIAAVRAAKRKAKF